MTPNFCVRGIKTIEVVEADITGVPDAEALSQKEWMKVGDIVNCLRYKLSGKPLRDVTKPKVMAQYRKYTSRMIWISGLESCIEGNELPSRYDVEIFIPREHGEILIRVFQCNSLCGRDSVRDDKG